MDNEAKVRAAKSTRRRFKLLGEGVQFVGSLLVCPECGLVTLLLPGRAGASESRIVLKPLV